MIYYFSIYLFSSGAEKETALLVLPENKTKYWKPSAVWSSRSRSFFYSNTTLVAVSLGLAVVGKLGRSSSLLDRSPSEIPAGPPVVVAWSANALARDGLVPGPDAHAPATARPSSQLPFPWAKTIMPRIGTCCTRKIVVEHGEVDWRLPIWQCIQAAGWLAVKFDYITKIRFVLCFGWKPCIDFVDAGGSDGFWSSFSLMEVLS